MATFGGVAGLMAGLLSPGRAAKSDPLANGSSRALLECLDQLQHRLLALIRGGNNGRAQARPLSTSCIRTVFYGDER
jgi:hypothetical protein